MIKRPAILLCLGSLCCSSYAGDIYRWVDDQGRTHLSDIVPEKYKKSAKRIDSRQFEVSDEQRQEAEARAAQERSRADQMTEGRSTGRTESTGTTVVRGTGRAGTNAGNDCAAQFRMYRESLECFAPYVTVTGAVKAEAFVFCTPVPDPSHRCGPPPPLD